MKLNHLITFIMSILIFISSDIYAACGATDRTWDGSGNQSWGKNANWSGNNQPDTAAENAIIVAATRPTRMNQNRTVGCVDIQSGELRWNKNNRTLIVQGDYYNAPVLNTQEPTGTNAWLQMDGSGAQTLTSKDPIINLRVSNNTTLTIDEALTIIENFEITGTGTTVYFQENLTLSQTTGTVTIPSGATVELSAGKTITSGMSFVVNGTLTLKAGATLALAAGTTLTVGASGQIRLEGASGNVSSIVGNGGYIDMTVNGSLYADYFRIDNVGTGTTGLQVNGTISKMDNGEFHFINNNGYAMTWGAAASIPSTLDSIGFFDENGFGTEGNINANAYNNGAVLIDNYSGIGGTTNEADSNNQVNWGSQAGTFLTISNNSNAGVPTNPVTAGSAAQEFAIFSFALNQASTATDITSVTFTLTGTASASDVDFIRVYNQGASCQVQGAQIGSDLTMSGSPAQATITIPAATVTTNSKTPACIHVYLQTTGSAENSATIGLEVSGTADVTNSQAYAFSPTSGPPASGPIVTISGDPTRTWRGRNNGNWRRDQNWNNGRWPNATVNCSITSGDNDLLLTESNACQNMTFVNAGVTNFNNGAFDLSVSGSLEIQAGHSFLNATNGTITMAGASNQSITGGTAFPGNLIINNSGGTGSVISVDTDTTINGDLTVTSGILRVSSGATLSVVGNIVVQNGAILDIESNGVLAVGNGSTVTINTGGTLEMIGGTNAAQMTSIGLGTNSYEVVINGTIKADKYIFDHLGVNGVTINAGATIDATYDLDNGTFKHPVNNNSDLLRLFQQVPGNDFDNLTFDLNGSRAIDTTIDNIYTDASVGAGTLTINIYSGNLGGPTYENEASYVIDWFGQKNAIDVTQEATAPATLLQGSTYVMGRYGFTQTLPGAVYNDTDITELTFTLTGTGAANYVDQVRAYYDTDCNSTGGTLIGSGTFSGNPAKVTFSSITGATIEASATTPPTRCVYIEFDIATNAVNASTLGIDLVTGVDLVDSEAFGVSSGTPLPINLGTGTVVGSTTTWTGAVSTDWYTAGNWNGGVPNNTLNCIIPDVANDPTIGSGTASCNSVQITNGVLTLSGGATLQVYGGWDNAGTFNQTGTLEFTDNGAQASNHTISDTSNSLGTVTLTNTLAGSTTFSGTSFTIANFTQNTGSSHGFTVSSGQTLTLTNGLTLTGGFFTVGQAGVLQIPNGQSINVNGGHFRAIGVAEATPQNLATKAKITNNGSGTWGFNATSGQVTLSGFQIDYINTSGLLIGGTTQLNSLTGGQFTNLSNTYGSVRAIQINTTGSIPVSSTNVGWNWGPSNTWPASSEGYTILYSSGCSNQSMDFTGWFGDWYEEPDTFDTSTKVSNTNCNLSLGGSASPVSLDSLEAVAYDGAVDIRWVTNLETDHKGFNIYRGTIEGNYVQVNRDLIRNISNSTNYQGSYRFIDDDVENGVRYYYYLEDFATNGDSAIHGPVTAVPLPGLGSPPALLPGQNDGTNPGGGSSNPDPNNPQNPTYRDLGDGVIILSETRGSLRIKIVPDTITYAASSWNGSYETVSIPGYVKQTVENQPELLEKIILIEVDNDYTSATLDDSSMTTSVETSHLIQPAPQYVLNGSNQLVPSFAPDATAYATNSFLNEDYFDVATTLESVGNKKYLKITVRPLAHNPVAQEVKRIDELIIDVGLDGSAWDTTPPGGDLNASPYIIENTLTIYYDQAGVYELTYEDIEAANADGAFEGISVDELRLYHLEEELPIEVISSDSTFGAGDKVRFYLTFTPSLHGLYNQAILSDTELNFSGAAWRVEVLDGDPTGEADSLVEVATYNASYEENNLAIFDDPLGIHEDHFYMTRIFAPYPAWPQIEYTDIEIEMPYLDSLSGETVEVKAYVKGSRGINDDINHHLGVYINNVPYLVDSQSFRTNDPIVLTFNIPAEYFITGTNNIRLKALADLVPTGEYDVIYIDKIETKYRGFREINGNYGTVQNDFADENIYIFGLDTNTGYNVYDITDYDGFSKVENFAYVSDGEGGFAAHIFAGSGASTTAGHLFAVIKDGEFLRPTYLKLTPGYETTLKDTATQADMVVIGSFDMLEAAQDLVDRREQEGLNVLPITLEQIYAEFSYGVATPQAIKDFVNYARDNWGTPALKYVLLLGDSTYDPLDHEGYGLRNNMLPMAFVKGQIYDYGSDNWFTTLNDDSTQPRVSIGRIPTTDPEVLRTYLDKLFAYEDGSLAPDLSSEKKLKLINNVSESQEKFDEKMDSLASKQSLADANFTTERVDRETMTDADFRTSILNAFDEGAYLVTYMGHGAEDQWAAESGFTHFENDDVDSMNNSTLPIVMTLNCLNADHFNADDTMISLAEKMVLKEDAGAIAYMGSTTMTTAQAQYQLANAFMEQMAQVSKSGDDSHRFGDIIQLAKSGMDNNNYQADVINSYTLIGDPSMKMPNNFFEPVASSSSSGGGGGGIPGPPPSGDSGGGLGCSSAFAGTGNSMSDTLYGIFEILILSLMYVAVRRTFKFFESRKKL